MTCKQGVPFPRDVRKGNRGRVGNGKEELKDHRAHKCRANIFKTRPAFMLMWMGSTFLNS